MAKRGSRKHSSVKRENSINNSYQFLISNDTSHKVLFSFKAKGLIMLVAMSLTIIFIIVGVTVLIAFTPLREYIPGYPNAETRRSMIETAVKADSLREALKVWEFQLENIQRIVKGEEPLNLEYAVTSDTSGASGKLKPGKISKEDSLMRLEVQKQERFSIDGNSKITQIEGVHFFTPIKGVITESYNPAIGHPYLDIAAPANSVVSSVLDGTVIMANWSDETGYTIQIQHNNDIISIYKHNSKLLKKSGDIVKAGTAIALVGDSGSISTGYHLHFELWHKGKAVDPVKYIKF